jgi:hypothetical protein
MLSTDASAVNSTRLHGPNTGNESEALAAAPRTAIPTVTATSSATETTATATATSARFLGARFIHYHAATIDTLAVESSDSGLRLLVGAHLDEAETLGTSGVAVHDYLGRANRAVWPKHLFEITLANVVTQITYIKLLAHGNSPEG